MGPLPTYLLTAVPSILTLRDFRLIDLVRSVQGETWGWCRWKPRLRLSGNLIGNDRKPPKRLGICPIWIKTSRIPWDCWLLHFCVWVCAQKKCFFHGVWNFTKSLDLVFWWNTVCLFGRKSTICHSELGQKDEFFFVLLNHLFCLWELIAIGRQAAKAGIAASFIHLFFKQHIFRFF